LRGRALAGVSGDTSARIYCQSLEAELISIAGHYWLSDDLRSAHKQSVCIRLENDQLVLDILSKNIK
jgi:septum site-determining protein MinC